ncbi:hypothetical protein BO85DRAFT_447471 [Aspergillus piperis CBS 112811]|uniref:Uncharacterized protein n=1 Tax=Aspergillus piperis CBS 112811 TaxID=1448313 RepID=A0A8G1VP86_9EURO|nr:hypothetical protein BO85DRAFT_447471 [Aspergillus piperis CBS 112811]RAH59585.1 hypothetical protein BO85DRAFT_447471 [Aspergillus piperis CBS 112811]
MKAKGIQTDLRVRDDVCGPGPAYLRGTCFTHTAYLAHRRGTMEGGGKVCGRSER